MKGSLLRSAGTMLAVSIALALPSAQTPEGPAFEVAALHLRAAPDFGGRSPFGLGRWSMNSATLGNLVSIAFDAPIVVGLPDWARSESYSIAAKAEDGVVLTREALRPRLRRFIDERFKLVTHTETKGVKGYALVVASDGPKLKVTTDPRVSTPDPVAMTALRNTNLRNPSVNMDFLAKALGALLNQWRVGEVVPVVNETGLAGFYDVNLSFAPLGDATDSPLASLFTALQEQLGLRLISSDGIPVPVLVIDHVEHPIVD